MTDSTPARPPQVTIAGWVAVLGSVFVVVTVFDFLTGLRTLEQRERVRGMLDDPPLKGTGIDLQQALSVMHTSGLVAAGCATATAILGFYCLRRNRQARLALSILVVPLFLTGMVAGGFLSSMVAVSAVMLWTRPARDWFEGRTPPPRTPEETEPSQPAAPSEPRRYDGFGTPDASPSDDRVRVPSGGVPSGGGDAHDAATDGRTGSGARPRGLTPYATADPRPTVARPTPRRHDRPRQVVQACVTVWVSAVVVVAGMAVAGLVFATDSEMVRDIYESDAQFADADVSLDTLRAASLVVIGLFIVWAVVAAVLAGLTFRGQGWARITLIISAAMCALLTLVMAVSAPPLLVVTGAAALTVVLLTRPEAVAWFRR